MTALVTTDAGLPPHARRLAERYEFLDELGRGGTSVVYRARERASGREVAIKLVHHAADDGGMAAARAAREARVAAGLRHPHVVRTLAVEEGEGVTALVSTYVAGGTLRAALRASAEAGVAWPYDRVARVLRDVASALAYAHARRIVHRDVKPENIFLDAADGRALLGDFGIARRLGPDALQTLAGGAAGTPSYMAPEQVAGLDVDERTDVYALGLVGWEMLVGRRPWQGETLYAVLHKQQHETLPALAPLRPDIPAYLLATVEGALAKDPARRWRDGAEFLRRLTPTPAQLPPLVVEAGRADTGGVTVRLDTPRLRRGRLAARVITPRRVAGAAAVAAVAALAVAIPARRPERRPTVPTAVTGVEDGRVERVIDPTPTVPGSSAVPLRIKRPRFVPPPAPPAPPPAPAAAPAAAPPPPAVERPTPELVRRARASDVRVVAAYEALIGAMRQSAGGEWEPRAVRVLRDEQRRWLAGRDAECARRGVAPAAGDAVRMACRAELADERAAALAARRARFAP